MVGFGKVRQGWAWISMAGMVRVGSSRRSWLWHGRHGFISEGMVSRLFPSFHTSGKEITQCHLLN